jgi:hypothetical protein
MKAADIIGRKIVRVEQSRVYRDGYFAGMDVTAVVLDNGWQLRPLTVETDGEYGTDLVLAKPSGDGSSS